MCGPNETTVPGGIGKNGCKEVPRCVSTGPAFQEGCTGFQFTRNHTVGDTGGEVPEIVRFLRVPDAEAYGVYTYSRLLPKAPSVK